MRQHGEGSEFHALREYAPGLDPRSIDWKQSAKHRALMCKEYFTERNQQVVFAFDCRPPDERAARGRAAARPCDQRRAADDLGRRSNIGDRVGVFGFDAQRAPLRPADRRASRNFALIQRQMAELEYRPEESNYTLGLMDLMGRLDRRSLIVVMTDFVDTVTAELMLDNLQRLSARHLVLFVAAARPRARRLCRRAEPRDCAGVARSVTGRDFVARARDGASQRLQRLGVHVHRRRARPARQRAGQRAISTSSSAGACCEAAESRPERRPLPRRARGRLARLEALRRPGRAPASAERSMPTSLARLPTLYRATLSVAVGGAGDLARCATCSSYLEALSARAYFSVYGVRERPRGAARAFFAWRLPAAVRGAVARDRAGRRS